MAAEHRCLACALAFPDITALKAHYKDDLHQCNLTRKVQGLMPLGAEDFALRAAELQAPGVSVSTKGHGKGKGNNKAKRKVSKEAKLLAKQQQWQKKQEAKMQKLQEKVERLGIDGDITNMDADMEKRLEEAMDAEQEREMEERVAKAPKIEMTQCLFSATKFEAPEEALAHMARQYGFFIPDIEYLNDVEGLVGYLRGKATIGYTCWYCDKPFQSWEAVRGHMVDKCHCKLPYDGLHPEINEFYDFGEVEEAIFLRRNGNGGTDLPGRYGDEEEEDDDEGEWEEVDDEAELTEIEKDTAAAPGQALVAVETGLGARRAEGLAVRNVAVTAALGDSELVPEYVLQDGRRLGHRSMARYYKQSIRPVEASQSELITNLILSYRSMGQEIIERQHAPIWGKHMTSAQKKEQRQIMLREKYAYEMQNRSRGYYFHGIGDDGHVRR